MHIIKSFFIAFAIYSKIPVPQFAWKEEDMKYTFCFFPWIGAVIGVCLYWWNGVCTVYHVGDICRTAVGMAVPLLITGGFHVDGFMDTMDAMHSYQPRERKLEILKDSHIGAFAVIMLAAYGLVFAGALSQIGEGDLMKIVCAGFFLSRCLSGLGAISFPPAKREGTLYLFADRSQRRVVRGTLYVQSLLCAGFMAYCSAVAGIAAVVAAVFTFLYYGWRSRREFGGVCGDTAGYFVLLCEEGIVAAVAAIQVLMRT